MERRLLFAVVLLLMLGLAAAQGRAGERAGEAATARGRGQRMGRISISKVDQQNIDELLRRNQAIILLFIANEQDKDSIMFLKTLSQNSVAQPNVVIGKTTDKTVHKRFGVAKPPALLVIGNGGEEKEQFEITEEDPENLINHMAKKINGFNPPRVGYMTSAQRMRNSANEATMYALVNFTNDRSMKWQNYFFRRFDSLAAKQTNESTLRFMVADAGEFLDLAHRFKINDTISLPLLALQDALATYKYPQEAFSTEAMLDWIERWRMGQLTPYRRSGVVVNNVPGTLFTLTTSNFASITGDWSKDVLVLFYGPKCPFSKEFLDIEMPKLLQMVDHVPSLVVAKIDCSVNECPSDIVTAYPTFSLYKGCKKTEVKGKPAMYWEVREADDLYRWLKKNSYYSIPKKPHQLPEADDLSTQEDPVAATAEHVASERDPLVEASSVVM